MRVVTDGFIEIWIYPGDAEKFVRCFFGEMEVDINLLDFGEFVVYEPSNLIFEQRAKQVVSVHQRYLLEQWDEMNG